MKNLRYILAAFLASCLVFFGLCSSSIAAEKVYVMKGKVKAIEVDHKTVVVDAPLQNKKIFTVGGPLSDRAVLKKGKKAVTLADFKVGDPVTVRWKATKTGHLILGLQGKQGK